MEKLCYTKYFTPDTLQAIITAKFANKHIQPIQINKKYDPISLVTKKGILNKPIAIMRYLSAGTNLSGSNSTQRDEINIWMEFLNIQILPLLNQIYGQVFGEKQAHQKKYNYSMQEITKNLKILDQSLKFRTFLVGHNLTIVDIALVCLLENLFKLIIDEGSRKKLTNLSRWHNFVRDIPVFNEIMGKKLLCGSKSFQIQFRSQQKVQVPNKEENKKEKNDTKFILDQWKREFQNSQNQKAVVQSLLDEFDSQNWSVWKVHYDKDTDEGKVLFLTQNLANGTLNRLEALRKVGFGSWGVFGEEGNYEIRGVFLWKGTQIAQAWKQHPSFEYHNFTKLDPSNPHDRQIIFDYWLERECAEGLMQRQIKRLL